MAGSLNKVMLIGHLGADPEIRSLPSGNKVANLSVATSESWRDKDSGERKEKTEWHRVVLWTDGLVKVAEQYLKKGAKVYIEGKIVTRKWQDQEGHDKYSTEIHLQGFNAALTMLDSKKDGDQGGGERREERRPEPEQSSGRRPASQAPAFESSGMDDDIPF